MSEQSAAELTYHIEVYDVVIKYNLMLSKRNLASVMPKHRRTFERNDLAGWIHDGAVSWDGPADRCIWVGHVNDHHLRLLAHLLPHTDELVRLHGECAEADVGRVDP